MSTINVSNLILTLQQKIGSSISEADILYYTKAIQQLKTGNVFVVNYASDLPAPSTVLGSLYYVNETEILYVATVYGWVEIYTSTINAIFSWGQGSNSALGDGTTADNRSPVREFCSATDWCQVSGGHVHTVAIKTSGELWSWGAGSCGRLGDGTTANSCSPVREFCFATDWCQVSAGCIHVAAVKTTGQIWSWGDGACGRLGDGTTANSCSPVREFCSATDWCQVSLCERHAAAIKTSGELWAWGNGICGRLGDGTIECRCSPVREFCSATNWCQVNAGYRQTLAIKTSGELWGFGATVAVGDGRQTPRCSPVREICSATDWCQIGGGRDHTIAIKTSGQLWAWGYNTCGVLGDGTTTNKCSPVREFCSATDWYQASGSLRHSLALKTSGQIWAWGNNNFGQLGDGTTATSSCSPVREITSATSWCQVSAGSYHTVAIQTRSF